MPAEVSATRVHVVGADDTAAAVGSGSLDVLATPRLLAWCEAATCAAAPADLPEGSTTVGTRVSLAHRAPTPVGGTVRVTATCTDADGARLGFAVRVVDDTGRLVAEGEIRRAVVDADTFVAAARQADGAAGGSASE